MENLTNNMTNLPEERGWEYKQITVTRVPGYGFGIAVSGGRDNPHFASGDPSIAVSDVLVAGPAERTLQVNDRIISVNGISLQNVDYATAVQVLRDSGDTVVLVVKRRTNTHQHQHSLSASYSSPPLGATAAGIQPAKITLTKNSKKEDFGIVLGCKLFIKEISSKARDQLLATNQYLVEGDFITKINNNSCNDIMSLKEAKKIIDNSKDKLNLTIARDVSNNATISHQTQSSVSTTGAVNNYYKGDDYLINQSYSNQNLYVQPPTRNPNLNTSNGFVEEKSEPMNSNPATLDDKSNLAPRGRLRGPLSDANLSQLDRASSIGGYGGKSRKPDEPPRPPPPRPEGDYYSSRRQLYEEDPLIQKTKQSIPDVRFITFQKEGSVGIRLTGGNYVGIFVTAVQPGSPASLQGLQPGDKILKVNDMDMTGVTREEAVLFLLSLQDRIELIVQFCKDEYENIVASQKGDSFYIKTHFHYDNPAKGEMSFRSGDTFHVVDTLYNGVVGCWQVYRVGRNNQQLQKGIIPNKARAEELATAQFNATKKEMSTNESRGSFFRRRRSSNRRSKSLGKEHWDDILFSDCVSKFPAYERVVLKHPGFTRPVILFGPIADIARDRMLKDFPDKFISPQLENGTDEPKVQKSSNIIRLSAIRDVISTGKHALLDITPNAVERLNYAQMYPIVIFFKAESKIIIKQLRQGLPKSAHKSSKKLLEQCQKLDKVWNHIFSATVTLNDNTENWYRKVRELIDKQQTGALWMSESKPEESLSDDFLFPMSSLRLSYASSPESDLEHSPGPPVSLGATTSGSGPGSGAGSTGGRLAKASSDPSVVMPADSNTDTLPPYQPTYDSRYGFSNQNPDPHSNNISPDGSGHNSKDALFLSQNQLHLPPDGSANAIDSQGNIYKGGHYGQNMGASQEYHKSENHKRQSSNVHGHYSSKSHNLNDNSPMRNSKEGLYGTAPDLPPRVDRTAKPGSLSKAATNTSTRSAHERLFGSKAGASAENNTEHQNSNNDAINNKHSSLERRQNSKSDSLSSYDSFNNPNSALKQRLGPNAHDDLKSSIPKIDAPEQMSPSKYQGSRWEQPPGLRHNHEHISRHAMNSNHINEGRLVEHNPENMSPRHSREVDKTADILTLDQLSSRIPGENGRNHDVYNRYNRSPSKPQTPKHVETKTDYGKYSRNNTSQDYTRHSHQDLTQAHLSIHQSAPAYHHSPMKSSSGMYPHSNGIDAANLHHMQGINGPPNTYKPVPPPKPKNYKPPFKNQPPAYGANDAGNIPSSNNGGYQHGKSHSNPVNDQRSPNYYYNMPASNDWHTETAVRYTTNMHGHYDMAPSGNGPNPGNGNYEPSRRHTSISYSSRNEAMMQMTSQDIPPYGRMEHGGEPMLDSRPNIVDLQGSREQRGSAFELYRKPVHHNMSLVESTETNITGSHLSLSSTNYSDKDVRCRLSLATPTNCHNKPNNLPLSLPMAAAANSTNDLTTNGAGDAVTPKQSLESSESLEPHAVENSRDVTCAVLDHRGGLLVNDYWGVSLEVPENALPPGVEQQLYFVITDPRTCENAPPLDLENGETMLSPLVMCGPTGIEFQKPVILNIPHYANTLPSMGISLKATDSEKDIHTDWDNILLPSNHAANSVAVKVDHF